MQHRGISTESITASAIAITKQDGLASLTMPKIAKALGIKSQSLYNHVSNLNEVKTNMSIALFSALKTRLLEDLVGLTGKAAIKAYFTIFYAFCLEYKQFYEIFFLPGKENSDKLDQSFHAVIQILHQLLAGMIADSEQIQLYKRTLLSAFVGFVLNDRNHFFQDGKTQGKEALDDILNLVIQGIK
ncbi:TetR/AcrR family transcriptional regulator [Secundilactobacillus hailunensis]|uniref:TetR/AcrR family transcriptional regulator n=1 Tax=Secundilactobacillus hailunensis TaxID=2559923 RepID=A0ABW1TB29_9LACO|nr:TetR/AcrR family transcriptional regulator [Secundilactobacillus hailunensis]